MPVGQLAPAPSDRATILLIEDDPGAVRLLRTYLEGEGYGVAVATDGVVTPTDYDDASPSTDARLTSA